MLKIASKKVVGYAWWEFLVLLSLVLTVASGLIWFNLLQPQAEASNLEGVEKAKHQTFNKIQESHNLYQSLNLKQINFQDTECYTDIQVYTIKGNLPELEQISDNQKYISDSLDQLKTETEDSIWNENFDNLSSLSYNFHSSILDSYNQTEADFTALQEISKTCQQDWNTKNISDSVLEYIKESKVLADQRITDSERVLEAIQQPRNLQEIFDLSSLKETNFYQVDNFYTEILTEFQDIEDWQESYNTKTDNQLEIIYIQNLEQMSELTAK